MRESRWWRSEASGSQLRPHENYIKTARLLVVKNDVAWEGRRIVGDPLR